MSGKITPKQQRFVDEYLIDLNATRAYKTAYGVSSEKVAASKASRMVRIGKVAAAIQLGMDKRAQRTEITADQVLKELWQIGTADPNDLIEFRRTCCRYCSGEANHYQFTQREMTQREADWHAAKIKDAKNEIGPFDRQGGIGFDARKPPNADCMECFGEGLGQAYAKDTRQLSNGARRLYAGVKQTREGLEVKMHDQATAILNVGKHLGMFAERKEITGRNGGPVVVSVRFVRE